VLKWVGAQVDITDCASTYNARPAVQRVVDVCKYLLHTLKSTCQDIAPCFGPPDVAAIPEDVQELTKETVHGCEIASHGPYGGVIDSLGGIRKGLATANMQANRPAVSEKDIYLGTLRVRGADGVGPAEVVPFCNMALKKTHGIGDDEEEEDKKEKTKKQKDKEKALKAEQARKEALPCTLVSGPEGATILMTSHQTWLTAHAMEPMHFLKSYGLFSSIHESRDKLLKVDGLMEL